MFPGLCVHLQNNLSCTFHAINCSSIHKMCTQMLPSLEKQIKQYPNRKKWHLTSLQKYTEHLSHGKGLFVIPKNQQWGVQQEQVSIKKTPEPGFETLCVFLRCSEIREKLIMNYKDCVGLLSFFFPKWCNCVATCFSYLCHVCTWMFRAFRKIN